MTAEHKPQKRPDIEGMREWLDDPDNDDPEYEGYMIDTRGLLRWTEHLEEQLEALRKGLEWIEEFAAKMPRAGVDGGHTGFVHIERRARAALGSSPASESGHWRYGEGRLLPEEQSPAKRPQ